MRLELHSRACRLSFSDCCAASVTDTQHPFLSSLHGNKEYIRNRGGSADGSWGTGETGGAHAYTQRTHACMHARTQTDIQTHMHTNLHMHTHTHEQMDQVEQVEQVHARTHTHTHKDALSHAHTQAHTHKHARAHKHARTHTHTHVRTRHTHTRTHTRTHTHVSAPSHTRVRKGFKMSSSGLSLCLSLCLSVSLSLYLSISLLSVSVFSHSLTHTSTFPHITNTHSHIQYSIEGFKMAAQRMSRAQRRWRPSLSRQIASASFEILACRLKSLIHILFMNECNLQAGPIRLSAGITMHYPLD